MARTKRMTKSMARTAPKSQENYLIENAKKLQLDPLVLLPVCTDENQKYFKKIKKQLQKVHHFSHDEKKLDKLSNKKSLEGALAGTLLLALAQKAPYLAALRFPSGDVMYAQRGKAPGEKLVGVQHFDNPIYRLCCITDIVYKKNLHVYSWDTGYICTGKDPQPPREFIDFLKTKIGFPAADTIITCPHISKQIVQKKEYLPLHYLYLHWKSAPLTIAICENCAKTTKNTIFTLSKYMIQRNLSKDFTIEVMTQIGKHSLLSEKQKHTAIAEYLTGKLTDHELIKKIVKSQEEHAKHTEEKLLMLDGVSYGTDIQGFIAALHPTPLEKDALVFILQKIKEPLILSQSTPSKIIERYWGQYGNEFLESIVQEKHTADSLFKLNDTPLHIIHLAHDYTQRRSILSQLPQYTSLPPLALFADTVARTYRTFGEKNALAEIRKHPDTPKAKSIAYAFLLAFGKASEVKWKYSKDEIEYGEFLQNHAQNLLDVEPQKYSTTLQHLLNACGSSETIE